MSQISDLLEKARGWILVEGGVVCPHKFGGCKHDNENCPVFCIDQALKLLKQQPAAGVFTKKVRILLATQDRTAIVRDAYDLCDRLDRAEASKAELLEACKFAKAHIKKGSQKKALPILRAAIAKATKEG